MCAPKPMPTIPLEVWVALETAERECDDRTGCLRTFGLADERLDGRESKSLCASPEREREHELVRDKVFLRNAGRIARTYLEGGLRWLRKTLGLYPRMTNC
jgi:hypothetical protein